MEIPVPAPTSTSSAPVSPRNTNASKAASVGRTDGTRPAAYNTVAAMTTPAAIALVVTYAETIQPHGAGFDFGS